jgi:ketosteroid isomerase-like protein
MSDEDVVDRLFRAVEAGSVDELREIYTPETEIWHNDGSAPQTADENIRLVSGLASVVSNLEYEVIRRAPVGDGFIQQHVLRGTFEGEPIELPAAMYLAVQGGHITRIEEYIDGPQGLGARIGMAALSAADAASV